MHPLLLVVGSVIIVSSLLTMTMSPISFCSLIATCFLLTCATTAATSAADRLALLEFKAKIISDPHQVFSSWNDSAHFCQWPGVTCSRRHQRVTQLSLPRLKLVGSLLPSIGNLSFLRVLNVQNNDFHDQIPQEIGRLFRLKFLGLENNSFSGEIPVNISRCTNLEMLGLGSNELVGQLPDELSSLTKLEILYIYFNNLTGEIPASFGNLSSLGVLSAAGNRFTGKIPETLGQLKKLWYIAFGANKLSGTIPPSIFNMSSLIYLHFPANQLEGTLPSNLGFTLPNLEVINVGDNQFTGSIPASISNATNLMRLTIPLNGFTGNVPNLENLYKLRWVSISDNQLGNRSNEDLSFLKSLINATSLELLAIHDNKFGGKLPENFGDLSKQLAIISIGLNQISGSIPAGIGNFSNLEILYVENNQFTGGIPMTIGNLQKLQDLRLHKNKFSGNIPSSLGNLTLLTRLDISSNNLGGSVPSSLGKCQDLLQLDLSDNNLNGSIPPEILGISSLSIYLDLSRNQLTDSLPMAVGNLTKLGGLDVSENNLSGEIPSSLGQCVSIQRLIMSRNSFQGSIPSSLSSLRAIEKLDFSHNNLSGQIPKFLEDFPLLQNLSLSFNHFEGQVPVEGVFKNSTALSITGNNNLCGGIPELNLPTCFIKGSQRKGSKPLKLILPLVLGILALALLLAFSIFIWLRRKKKKESVVESPPLGSILHLSYENLLKMTGGFSSDNLIGAGNFGSVYKGTLDGNETMMAVKVLKLQHHEASKTFMSECETLRSIRHRNLVRILTACASVDFQGNEFKALVYEFMVNGSLEEWLHPIPATNETHKASRNLDLLQRLNIAVDVACALNYLHYQCDAPIAHCDLKPSNILLDKDLVGHVGDFGLARFLLQAANSNNSTSTLGIRGTIGYIPPEYALGSEVSTDGDVYSFGILLLEIFTGKRPTDEMFKDSMNLHNFAKSALPDRMIEILDPVLQESLRTGELGASDKTEECLIQIFEIGVACSADMPRERMKMDDVETKLRSVGDKLLRRGMHRERTTFYHT